MRKWLFVLMLIVVGSNWAKSNSIRGRIYAPVGTELQLWSMQQHKSELLGSAKLANDSIFLLAMPVPAYHGAYLLRWKGKELEFLYDGEAISFRLDASDKLEIVRGKQWMQYREQKRLLLDLRIREAQLDSQLTAMSPTAFGYDKIARKKKRNLRKQEKMRYKLSKEIAQIGSRTLLFEWHWLGKTNADLRKQYSPAVLLDLVSLSDTLALYHNRWPGFMRTYFSTYAPIDSQPLPPLLLQRSKELIGKAKKHPAFLEGTIDFLQWGMEQFQAPEAMQFLGKEKALYIGCQNTALPKLHRQFVQALQVGQKRPPLESLKQLPGATEIAFNELQLYVFWSAECPPCVIEFDQFHRWLKHNRPEIQVTAIAIQGNSSSWQADKQAFDSWKHLIDTRSWEGEVARDWQVTQLPYFVLTNANGTITSTFSSTQALRQALER
jgi:thiol-disulfide isomerase/thioredoxin